MASWIRQAFDNERHLAFMHIPKSAGTSIKTAIANALNVTISDYGYDELFMGDFSSYDEIELPQRSIIFIPGKSPVRDVKFIAGHISLSTLQNCFPHFQSMTILRMPLTRLLSNWVFMRARETVHFGPWGPEWTRRNILMLGSFLDFLTLPECVPFSDNLTTRMLLRPHRLIPIASEIHSIHDDELFYEAIGRLSSFAFVDLVENPRLVDNLSVWMGTRIKLGKENEAQAASQGNRCDLEKELPLNVFELMCYRSRIDARIWNWVADQILTTNEKNYLQYKTFHYDLGRYRQIIKY